MPESLSFDCVLGCGYSSVAELSTLTNLGEMLFSYLFRAFFRQERPPSSVTLRPLPRLSPRLDSCTPAAVTNQ